jgi:polysaccharide pyruvyl transferase WcaK-like protein
MKERINLKSTAARSELRVLLVGYNGANNTGAEALLLSDIEDVRAALGPDALITVPTLNESNLRRYVQEGPNLRIVPVPSIFPLAVRQLVAEHDLIMLVEGHCYMDDSTSALLWAYLWATHCAHAMGKPCLAYAVDAGQLSPGNRRLVRREASKTDLIITRSNAAADRLRACGVTAPIKVTADNAFAFQTARSDEGWVQRVWPEARSGLAGLAVVNYHLWPVVMRPWGKSEDCYKWPYYFSTSPERRRATAELADGYAALADCLAREHDKSVALICMEELDEPFARKVHQQMVHADRARVFSAREYNASQMTTLLRSLDLLMTSRYHGCVLSLAAQVPQLAVGHDLRLRTIYDELGLTDQFFVDPNAQDPCVGLKERVEKLLANPALEKESLRRGYEEHLAKARGNRELLRSFVKDHGWEVVA